MDQRFHSLFQMCCDCCLLGKAAQELGLHCDHKLSVGHRCGTVFQSCCTERVPDNHTTTTPTPAPAPQTECGWIKHYWCWILYFCIVCTKAGNWLECKFKKGNCQKTISWHTEKWEDWSAFQCLAGVVMGPHSPLLGKAGKCCLISYSTNFTYSRSTETFLINNKETFCID